MKLLLLLGALALIIPRLLSAESVLEADQSLFQAKSRYQRALASYNLEARNSGQDSYERHNVIMRQLAGEIVASQAALAAAQEHRDRLAGVYQAPPPPLRENPDVRRRQYEDFAPPPNVNKTLRRYQNGEHLPFQRSAPDPVSNGDLRVLQEFLKGLPGDVIVPTPKLLEKLLKAIQPTIAADGTNEPYRRRVREACQSVIDEDEYRQDELKDLCASSNKLFKEVTGSGNRFELQDARNTLARNASKMSEIQNARARDAEAVNWCKGLHEYLGGKERSVRP